MFLSVVTAVCLVVVVFVLEVMCIAVVVHCDV